MAQARRRNGAVQPVEIRRIGYRHAIVTPPVRTQLLDMNLVEVQIENVTRSLAAAQRTVTEATARLADLRAQQSTFEALAIDRDEQDPPVPQTAPIQPEEPPARR